MTEIKSRRTIETFLTLFLLILFTYFVAVMVVESKNSFDRVLANKTEDDDARIALSYIQKMVLKNDRQDGVTLINNSEGMTLLKINHDQVWSTYIYYEDGYLYENYTDVEPNFKLSTKLVPIKDLSFSYSESTGQLSTTMSYEYQGEWMEINQRTTLKSLKILGDKTVGGLYE